MSFSSEYFSYVPSTDYANLFTICESIIKSYSKENIKYNTISTLANIMLTNGESEKIIEISLFLDSYSNSREELLETVFQNNTELRNKYLIENLNKTFDLFIDKYVNYCMANKNNYTIPKSSNINNLLLKIEETSNISCKNKNIIVRKISNFLKD